MALLQTGLAKSLAEDYTIDNSVRLDNAGADNDSNHLVRLQDAWGGDSNQKTWTISWWMKWDNEDSNSERFIYWVNGARATSDTMGYDVIQLNSEQLQYYCTVSAWATTRCQIKLNRVFRDPSAWYHCMIVMDSTLAAAADRTKFYVNGVRETSFATDTQIGQNEDTNTNMDADTYVGASISVTSTQSFGGYIAEFYRIDGQALTPASFGETDATTNQWKPIDASGLTFGTNGFYQKYAGTELADSFTDSAESRSIVVVGNTHTDTTIKKIGTASAQFDGSGDLLRTTSLPLGDNFTVECWVYPTDSSGNNSVWSNEWGTGTPILLTYSHVSHGATKFGVYWGTGSENIITGSGTHALNDWYHVALVRSAGTITMYIDGSSEGTSSQSAEVTNTDFVVGAVYTTGTQTWNGYIDELRVSDIARYTDDFTTTTTAFTDDDNTMLLLHMDGSDDGTTFTDSGTFAGRHTITANGDVANTRAVRKIGDSSIAFDGTGDYLSSLGSSSLAPGSGDFTYECWFYQTGSGHTYPTLWTNSSSTSDAGGIRVSTGDGNRELQIAGGSGAIVTSDTIFAADTWHHMAVVRDSGTLSLYLNGASVGSASNSTDFSTDDFYGGSIATSYYFAGYQDELRLSDTARYDGAFTPSTTAFTADANTMLLIHSNWDGGLGADSSGNYNTFTPTNLVATDQMVDSPTNNFCTFNPLSGSSDNTYSEGNLSVSGTGGSYKHSQGTVLLESGKWYWENYMGSTNTMLHGITDSTTSSGSDPSDGDVEDGYYYGNNGNKRSLSGTQTSYGATYTSGDIISTAVDLDSGTQTVTFYKNGSSQGSIDITRSTTWVSDVIAGDPTNLNIANFGQDGSFAGTLTAQGNQDGNSIGDFYYEPPTDFLALCTSNLPDPEIKLPGDYFNTVLYTGTDSSNAITGVGFSPDLLSIKNRTSAEGGLVFDVNRGQNYLQTSQAAGQGDGSAFFTSLDSDGFTVTGTDGSANASGDDYVAWNWLGANGTTANTTGTIDSTVSANTTAGFSIITYTGVYPQDPATIGHGLSQKPELVIIKRTDAGANWWIVGSDELTSWDYYMGLNATNAQASGGYFESTAPTASVIELRNDGDASVNGNGNTYVAYAFHSVEGYSKVGSYTGNGDAAADAPFVYCGFRPAWVMIKRFEGASQNWIMYDNKRSAYNVVDDYLEANTNDTEETDSSEDLDFVSNGFRIRTDQTQINPGGAGCLFMAFAEAPFKYSNAR